MVQIRCGLVVLCRLQAHRSAQRAPSARNGQSRVNYCKHPVFRWPTPTTTDGWQQGWRCATSSLGYVRYWPEAAISYAS